MKKNRALFFTVKTCGSNLNYYSMLLYALETLNKSTPSMDFDVIVYHDIEGSNADEVNVNGFNIKKEFPFVNCLEKRWPESKNYTSPPNPNYFYKWLCIEHIVHNSSYEHLAYFDCDVAFLGDFNKVFDTYENKFYGVYEGTDELKFKLIGKYNAMCSGQFIFKRDLLTRIPIFFQKVLEKSNYLCENANRLLSDHPSTPWIKELMEQYAGHRVLLDFDIPIEPIHSKHVTFGKGTCEVEIKDNNAKITNPSTEIVHYTNKNAFVFVPEKYRTKDLQNLFFKNIIENKLNRELWG